jgi:hypothetical protein
MKCEKIKGHEEKQFKTSKVEGQLKCIHIEPHHRSFKVKA